MAQIKEEFSFHNSPVCISWHELFYLFSIRIVAKEEELISGCCPIRQNNLLWGLVIASLNVLFLTYFPKEDKLFSLHKYAQGKSRTLELI